MSRKNKKSPTVQAAGSALDMLVRQFSQPLACLRELVQNSIDAGTNQIEVTVTRLSEEACLRLTVSDTGEGMTEQIIRSQLTRLFSSQKENDLTKVGKFGIGFVSVFALEPEAVVVDTGREGQNWRVLFHPNRSFDLIQHNEAIEGTRVSLYLSEKRFRYEALVADVTRTLKFWCRHCKTVITVNGNPIGESFSLPEPLVATYSEAGTRLVVAVAGDDKPFFGFYNQGLTLWEGTGGPCIHLTYKIDSRYFEHTLTRDKIIENEDYNKGMALLERVARQDYPRLLFEALRKSDDRELWQRLQWLSKLGVTSADIEQTPLFADHSGQLYSLKSLRGQRVFYHPVKDELQTAVHDPQTRRIVLDLHAKHPALKTLEAVEPQPLDEHWGVCHPVDVDVQILAEELRKVRSRLGVNGVLAVRWSGEEEDLPLVFQAEKTGAVEWKRSPRTGDVVLLNVQHKQFSNLLDLARWAPPLACQVLQQQLLLLRPEAEREALSIWLTESSLTSLGKS